MKTGPESSMPGSGYAGSIPGSRPASGFFGAACGSGYWFRVVAVLVIVGLTLASTLHGQEFQVHSWHVEDGLPDGTITALAQTQDGLLWVGTRKGLFRFDGASFVRLGVSGEGTMVDHHISGLLVDKEGGLWITGESGVVARWSDGKLVTNKPRPSPTQPPVRTGFVEAGPEPSGSNALVSQSSQWFWQLFQPLALDGEGFVWCVGGDGVTRRFRGIGQSEIMGPEKVPQGRLHGLASDSSGRIWLFKGSQLLSFAAGAWKEQTIGPGSADEPAPLCSARDGGVWLASAQQSWLLGGGVSRFTADGGQTPAFPIPAVPGSLRSQATVLLEDRGGRLWLGTLWNGVFYRDPTGTWKRVQADGPLSQSVVSCIFQDQQGAIWVGTEGEGLHQIAARSVKMLVLPEAARESIVTTSCATRDGSLWFGTDGKGLYQWNAGQFTYYGLAEGLPHEHVCSVLESGTNLWVGTWAGLAKREGTKFVSVEGPPQLRRSVLALFQDHSGDLWVGSQAGLLQRAEDGNWAVFNLSSGKDFVDIRCIAEDSAGTIWVAAIGTGLLRLEGGLLAPFRDPPWSGRADVRSVFCDRQGALWIGTASGGLFRLWEGKQIQFSMAEGLPNDSIPGMIEDGQGNLWMSSDNGIFGCSLRLLTEYIPGQSPSLLCWQLTPKNGLAARACSGSGQPVATRTPDGRLWVPNMRGVAVIDPSAITRGRLATEVLLEGVTADGVALTAGRGGEIRAPASTRRFEFHYTAPDFASTPFLRFRYRLEDLDRDWVDAGVARAATYSRLPPAEYRFRVMAGGADGIWREAKQPLLLRVVPRFWQTVWFRTIGISVLVAAIAGGVALNERRKLRQRLQRLESQQALEAERRRIARDLHDDVGARLTEILLLGELARRGTRAPEALMEQINTTAGKVRELVAAMEEVIWTVNPRNDSLTNVISYLCDYVDRFLTAAGVTYRMDLPDEIPDRMTSATARHNLLLALKEGLNNAVRHGAPSEVHLGMSLHDGALVIEVRDNGNGFDTARTQRPGNGLQSMRSRLETVGGRFELASQPGKGTTLRFVFPVEDETKR